ncbi:MAG: hypothetical protein M3336_03300 [Chloroflexota bacterium]|nr:hypothetical protein [Chloroflexota bacterium]
MASTPYSEGLTSSEMRQRTMLADLTQQRWLIGVAVGVGVFLLLNMLRKPPAQERAARDLVRDWRKVDDVGDARNLLGEHLPTIVRPVLLLILEQLERQIDVGLRRLERTVERL